MSINTPTDLSELDFLFRDPVTGLWKLPVWTFNTATFGYDRDPLNEDRNYQYKVMDHFYFRLKEKWLYHSEKFLGLLKYFTVKHDGDKIIVSLIDDLDKVSEKNINYADKKYIFRFIENTYVKKKFVSKIIKEYVNITHVKWYDLFNNTDNLKDLFAHKLKKKIINTVRRFQDKSSRGKK